MSCWFLKLPVCSLPLRLGAGKSAVPGGMESGAQPFPPLFSAVRQVLDALEGRRLKEIVVGCGPGAYGGIRVALAVADGLSWCTVPRGGFSSWNGLGLHHGEACVVVRCPAWRLDVGRLENGVLTDVPAVLPAEQARASVAECMGKGVPVFPRNGGSSGRPGNVGDCPRVSFCRGARGRVAVPGGGPQRRTSGKSGGTAVCEGSAHHSAPNVPHGP